MPGNVKKRILSGMRPSGKLHLGNLFGALSNWVKLQDQYECYYMVADWHALTTDYKDTKNIKDNTREMVIDWIASGLDPARSVMFLQSKVPEHAQLHLILSSFTPVAWLQRCPTYKEQLQQLTDRQLNTYGFLGYPVLQAADILLYNATAVPVGEDQLPHLELTREIARRFNQFYGNILLEPKALLTKVPRLLGTDGRKMSKSYDNCIYISDDDRTVLKKVKTFITDPQRIKADDPGHPEVCSVFDYYGVFYPQKEAIGEIEKKCRKGENGCVDCKKKLSECLLKLLEPVHERRKELEKTPGVIDEILCEGNKKAQKEAAKILSRIKEAMKLE